MNPDLWIVKTCRQFIWHDDDFNKFDAELNRFLHQPGLMEIISQQTHITDEYTVRITQGWFAPPPKPTKEVPNNNRSRTQQRQPERRGFFGRGG